MRTVPIAGFLVVFQKWKTSYLCNHNNIVRASVGRWKNLFLSGITSSKSKTWHKWGRIAVLGTHQHEWSDPFTSLEEDLDVLTVESIDHIIWNDFIFLVPGSSEMWISNIIAGQFMELVTASMKLMPHRNVISWNTDMSLKRIRYQVETEPVSLLAISNLCQNLLHVRTRRLNIRIVCSTDVKEQEWNE